MLGRKEVDPWRQKTAASQKKLMGAGQTLVYIGVQAVQPGHWPLLPGHHASCHAPEPGPARKCLCLLHQHLV